MGEKVFKNEVKSEIQKQILERVNDRAKAPKFGLLTEVKSFENDDKEDKVYFNFVSGGARLEIHGKTNSTYDVKFLNTKTNTIGTEKLDMKTGEWVQANEEYYVPWLITVVNKKTGDVKNYSNDLYGKRVFIAYESSALGDTLAWMPVVEKFRQHYNCEVICSSFHNDLFKDEYPNIEFVERGVPVQGMQMAFRLGWFGSGHASDRNPYDCHTRNLQQMAMDILGLDFNEIGELRGSITVPKMPKLFKAKKYVTLTTCSTAQFKYWNRAGGWQEVVDYLVNKGYVVVNVGKQPNNLRNVQDFTGSREMGQLMNVMQNATFNIGLPSGLAWLSWALGKKTIMITGISEHFCEFQEDNYRAENIDVCHGCFNLPYTKNKDGSYNKDEKVIFDKGNWLYCPMFEGTKDHFQCTKEITPQMVKKKVALIEKHLKNNIKVILDKEGNMVSKTTGTLISKYGE